MTANEISHPPRGSYDLHRTRGEIVNNRYYNCATCGVKRYTSTVKLVMLIITCTKYFSFMELICFGCRLGKYTASHGHGRSEIHGPRNGGSGQCHLSSCSYGGCHGKDNACVSNTSKQARRSIAPALDPIRSYR